MASSLQPDISSFESAIRATAHYINGNGHLVDDLMQEGRWALIQALQRTPEPERRLSFARFVIRRAMLKARDRHYGEPKEDVRVSDLMLGNIADKNPAAENAVGHDGYYQALETALGEKARSVAENLVRPTDLRVELKCQRRRSGRGARTDEKVPFRIVREALGIKSHHFKRILDDIRSFTAKWLVRDGLPCPLCHKWSYEKTYAQVEGEPKRADKYHYKTSSDAMGTCKGCGQR